MPFKFYLADLYTRTEITEPEGWKDVKNVIERDFPSHGMFSNYTDGTLKLGFVCDAATLLEAEYVANGVDGYYLFEVEEAPETSSIYTVIFSAEVDFTTRDYDEDFFKAEVNNSNTFLKVKNRSNDKISLNFQQTIDGSNRSKINVNDAIYSLATNNWLQFVGTNSGETIDSEQSDAASGVSYLVGAAGFTQITIDEIQKSKKVVSQLDQTDTINPTGKDAAKRFPILTLDRDAHLLFEYDFDIDINFTPDQYSGSSTYQAVIVLRFDISGKFGINGSGQTFENLDIGSISTSSPYGGTVNLTANSNAYARLNAGTNVSIDIFLSLTTSGTSQFTADFDINSYSITITDKTPYFPTTGNYIHIYDALTKHLDFITNESNYFYSELLGNEVRGYSGNGCLSDLYLINGYNIRQITDDDKAPFQSLNDYLKNLKGIGAIGWSIEEIDAPIKLGYKDIFWDSQSTTTATIRIYENLIYDIYVGDKIAFYNGEVLFGTYEVSFINYFPALGYSAIDINISANDLFYGTFGGDQNPIWGSWHYDILVTCNSSSEYREQLRVEEWRYFYGTNELIDLGTVQEYREEPFKEALYNRVELGFSKYANDENKPSTLEEFQSDSQWSLPTVKSENTLSLILKWVGSTFIFNESRDRLFTNKPTTSHRNDKDVFFSTITNTEITGIVDFDHTPIKKVTFKAAIYENYIEPVESFAVSGATDGSNNGTYTIDTTADVIHDLVNDCYIVTMTGSLPAATRLSDTINITPVYVGKQFKKLEANENMLSSSGLTRPEYFINQRNTIKRFLFRWGSFINSSIAYFIQTTSKTIRNLFYDVNGDFSSEIDTYDLDADCVNVQGLVQENANVSTDDLDNLKFAPNLINAVVEVCDDDYNSILDAHKGKGNTPYGYFSVISPNNELKQGWLLKMRRSPIDRIAEFQLLERYNPTIVFDGTKYGEVANVAAFQITNFKFTIRIDILNTFPTQISPFVDCMPSGTTDKGWYFSPWVEDGLSVGFANTVGGIETQASRWSIAGNKTYDFYLQRIGQDYEFGYDDTALLNFNIFGTSPAPTDSYLFGIRRGQPVNTEVLIGNAKMIKLEGLDGSGNLISELMKYEGANDNGVQISNTATNAPDNTPLIWHTA